MTESILVLRSPGGEVGRCQRRWGTILQGLLGLSPTFCVHTQTPLPTAPKDIATLSLTVLKDSERAARPVGRYLLHAKSYLCLWSLPPAVVWVGFFVLFLFFSLCGIFVPIPASDSRNSLGQKRYSR